MMILMMVMMIYGGDDDDDGDNDDDDHDDHDGDTAVIFLHANPMTLANGSGSQCVPLSTHSCR